MRYIGTLLMALALGSGGFYASWILKERLELLLVLRQMMHHLKARICHRNDTLAEAFGAVGSHFKAQRRKQVDVPADFFLRVAQRVEEEKNRPFTEIWRSEIAGIPEELLPDGAERRSLTELGDHLGYADLNMQEQTIHFYLEHADESIAARKTELEEKRKLYRSLGLAAGLCLVILLV